MAMVKPWEKIQQTMSAPKPQSFRLGLGALNFWVPNVSVQKFARSFRAQFERLRCLVDVSLAKSVLLRCLSLVSVRGGFENCVCVFATKQSHIIWGDCRPQMSQIFEESSATCQSVTSLNTRHDRPFASGVWRVLSAFLVQSKNMKATLNPKNWLAKIRETCTAFRSKSSYGFGRLKGCILHACVWERGGCQA